MFEKAARMKLRFEYRGLCSVEDLWDLSVEVLDEIFKELSREARSQDEESLLGIKSAEEEVVDLRSTIVRHIVETKLREARLREMEQKLDGRKQKIMEIIASKQDGELAELSIEDLQKKLSEDL